MGKMKTCLSALLTLGFLVLPLTAESLAPPESPLTLAEQTLPFSRSFLKTDEGGHGVLLVRGEPLSAKRLLSLSPWDLMELVQTLTGVEVPLSRFGDNDELTQAWRQRLVVFAASADSPPPSPPPNLFDPKLVVWDPGVLQTKNAWGQWTIHLAHRDIVQSDIPTLSPLEVQQAVELLTGRSYPIEFVLEHLEAFRAQITVAPRE